MRVLPGRTGKQGARKPNIWACILTLFLIGLNVALVSADSQTDKLIQERNKELDKIVEQQNQRIAASKEQAKSLKEEVAGIEREIKAVEDNINSLNQEIESTQKDIDFINNDIKLNEVALKKEQEKLKKGITILYERGESDPIAILASSDSVSSFLNQEKYLVTINEDIAGSHRRIKDIRKTLVQKKKEIDNKIREQENIKIVQERQREELNTRMMAKSTLIEQTKGDEQLYQRILAQALQDKSQVSSMVQALSSGASPAAIGLPYSGARAGQRIFRGEVIGKLGNTGFSTGAAPSLWGLSGRTGC